MGESGENSRNPERSWALTFLTEDALVSFMTMALEWLSTSAVLTARQRNAALAVVAIEAELAATLVRALTIALLGIAVLLAQRDVTQVALPTCEKSEATLPSLLSPHLHLSIRAAKPYPVDTLSLHFHRIYNASRDSAGKPRRPWNRIKKGCQTD